MNVYELAPLFAELFDGLKIAHGTGKGGWVKRPLRPEDYIRHLQGVGAGIGVAPLREDNTVMFAAIDLDEPDFEAAQQMQRYIPGTSWIERSRSGNAHVWVFFKSPCPAWVAMGVLKEACLAAGKKHVEVFPKNWDFSRVRYGNFINLPYHGSTRRVLADVPEQFPAWEYGLEEFIQRAHLSLNDPEKWKQRANWLQIHNPADRKELSTEYGTQQRLHSCAERILDGRAGIISEGGRNAVLFMLAKCLMNTEGYDSEEVKEILLSVNHDLFDPPEDSSEIVRILSNVERGRYTSTGCDDPLVLPYTDPDCPIAHPRR